MTEKGLALANVLKELNGIQRFSDMLLGMERIVEDMFDHALVIDEIGLTAFFSNRHLGM